MGKTIILTDSTADIPQDILTELDIEMVPLKVQIAGDVYLDQVTLDTQRFYQHLKQAQDLPTTSQPSPSDFVAAYQRCIDRGATDILAIHVSAALSGTFQSSMIAKDMIEEPNVRIEVMDSRNVAFCLGQMAINAARAARDGKTLEECKDIANQTRENQVFYFYLDTLECLQKGGRIGKAASLVGSLLNIKPLISFDSEGSLIPIEKVRGKKKAARRIFELVREKIAPGTQVQLGIVHGESPMEAEEWAAKFQEIYDVQETHLVHIGSTVAAHAGPHALGVLVVPVISS